MATIDTLLVRIEADLSDLKRELDKGARAVDDAAKKMRKSGKDAESGFAALGKTLGTFVTVAAIASIARFGKVSLDAAADIKDLSAQIGVTTDSFQELVFAGAQFGVTQENLSQSLAIFSRNIGQAANGNKEMIASLQALNIKILDANGALRSNDAILNDLVDAIANISEPARQAAVGAEYFGRGFAKLLPMFRDGSIGLDALRKAARDAGAVLSGEAVEAADAASDALKALELVVDKLAQTIAAKAAPYVKQLADNILNLMSASGDASKLVALNEEIAKLEARTADRPGSRLSGGRIRADKERLAALYAEKQALIDIAAENAKASVTPQPSSGGVGVSNPMSKEGIKLIADATAMRNALTAAIDKNTFAFEQAKVAAEAHAKAVDAGLTGGQIKQYQDLAVAIDAMTKLNALATEEDKRAAEEANKNIEALQKRRKEKSDALKEGQDEIEQNQQLIAALSVSEKSYEKVRAKIELLNKVKKAGLGITEEEISQIDATAEKLGEQKVELDKLKEKYDDAKQASKDFSHVIGTAFEDAILEGKKLGEVLKALEQDIARIIMRMAVTKPLENMLTGGGSSGGGGILDSLFSGFGNMFGGPGTIAANSVGGGDIFGGANFLGAVGFASGGSPPVGRASIVGERGPELFVPKTPGTIISNDNLKGAGGTYYIDARNADGPGLQRLESTIRELNGSIERRSVSAVLEHKRRNPAAFA